MGLSRISSFQEELSRSGISAALVTSRENVRYLTGYYTEAYNPFTVAVVPADGEPALVLLRQDESLARTVSSVEVVPHELGPDGFSVTAQVCRRLLNAPARKGALGLEFNSITVDRLRAFEKVLDGPTIEDVTPKLAKLRIIKEQGEQIELRRAGQLATWALLKALEALQPGVSEAHVKAMIEQSAYTEGARRWPDAIVQTETNVLSGPKVDRLHDLATGRTLNAGEVTWLLSGVGCNGYWGGDTARTAFISGKPPSAEIQHALEAAINAHRRAIENLGPGRTLAGAAQAADQVLADQDLQGLRVYRMFRGIGLSPLERPSAFETDLVLESGMSLCVQIYLRTQGFIVGQSDGVLITKTGAEALSQQNSH